jgi:hypothetical protein|tara:strand:+ start:80 stop:469 length:390 start_codon:yes stop_codon:yes gene_type:complete
MSKKVVDLQKAREQKQERTKKQVQKEQPEDNYKELIFQYLHCKNCLEELPDGYSPAEYSRLAVGMTKPGLQVVCMRHGVNVCHIDFEGNTHPADMSELGDMGGTCPTAEEVVKQFNKKGDDDETHDKGA